MSEERSERESVKDQIIRAAAMKVLYGDKLPDMVVAVRVELGAGEGVVEALPAAGMLSVSVRAYVEATLPPIVELSVLRAFGEHIRDEERLLLARHPGLEGAVVSMGKLERGEGEVAQ